MAKKFRLKLIDIAFQGPRFQNFTREQSPNPWHAGLTLLASASYSRDEKTDLRTRKVNGKVVAKIIFTKLA
jgi:hypothetical protein